MFRDANPGSFSAIYIVCGYTDLRYGIDSLAAIKVPKALRGTVIIYSALYLAFLYQPLDAFYP